MFRNTDVIAERMVNDLQLRKTLIGALLVFASAHSISDLKSTPIQYLFCDEIDEYPLNLEGQGHPVELAIARTRTFRNKRKVLLTSTTTRESTSAIWAYYLDGDMRHYHMPCPHASCRKPIRFEFAFEGTEKGGLKWDWGKPKSVYYQCPECGGRIEEWQKTGMMAEGVWKPLRKDLDAVPEGERSYRLPSLYSPVGWMGWDEIAAKWEKSYNVPSLVAEFRQTVLALPSIEASDKVDWEEFATRGDVGEEPYDLGTVPMGPLFLTAGGDVGKDHISWSVWGWGRDYKRYLIDRVHIDNCNIQDLSDTGPWAQASDFLKRTYYRSDGVGFPILRALIDVNAWPEIVKKWLRTQNGQQVMGCFGRDQLDQPVKVDIQAENVQGSSTRKTRVGALPTAQVGASFLKAEMVGAMGIERPHDPKLAPPGWIHMPKQGLTTQMCEELASETKIVERDKNGRITGTRWERVKGRRAEMLDTHNYARAAASLVGWDRFRERDLDRLQARIDAELETIRSAAAAEARGAPIVVNPEEKPRTNRKPGQISVRRQPEPEKASPQPRPGVSTVGVHTVGAPRCIVPTPRALRE